MNRIFYTRESIDTEAFIYDEIKKRGGRDSFIIVPNQYTLEGERMAISHMGTSCLMGVEIMTFSRLGTRLLEDLGIGNKALLNKTARHILISMLMHNSKDLKLLHRMKDKRGFVSRLHDDISSLKQHNVSGEELLQLSELVEGELSLKLHDMGRLLSSYELLVGENIVDVEDKITLYQEALKESFLLDGKDVWIYGFDTFTPRNIDFLTAIAKRLQNFGGELNIVLYGEKNRRKNLFQVSYETSDKIKKAFAEYSMSLKEEYVDKAFKYGSKNESLSYLEANYGANKGELTGRIIDESNKVSNSSLNAEGVADEGFRHIPITIVKANNIYSEIESAASHIIHLIRDKKLRYRDILVICNDEEIRLPLLKRVLEEYDIPVFVDDRRSITSAPVTIYLSAMIRLATGDGREAERMHMLKSMLHSLDDNQVEALENYVYQYSIKHWQWEKPFTYVGALDEDVDISYINEARLAVISPVLRLKEIIRENKGRSFQEFVAAFYDFLENELKIRELLAKSVNAISDGDNDIGKSRAIWKFIVDLLEKMTQVIGHEPFNGKLFSLIFEETLTNMKVAVLPPTIDDLLIGNMQRTRSGRVKATVIVGANDGLIPKKSLSKSIFTDREISSITCHKVIGRSMLDMEKEERIGIYRNLSRADESIWISYSMGDGHGEDLLPSTLIREVKNIFPGIVEHQDVVSTDDPLALISAGSGTVRHLSRAIFNAKKTGKLKPEWWIVWEALRKNKEYRIKTIGNVLDRSTVKLQEKLVRKAMSYEGKDEDIRIGMSSGEKYSRCPFAFFVDRAIRPKEMRLYNVLNREIGNMAHKILENICKRLDDTGGWNSLSSDEDNREYFAQLVKEVGSEILKNAEQAVQTLDDKKAVAYAEETIGFREGELSRYKLKRIEEICATALNFMVKLRENLNIDESRYEVSFENITSGEGLNIDSINGNVKIKGKIDRLDTYIHDDSECTLADANIDFKVMGVIDYKTGSEAFSEDEIISGYNMQLATYMGVAKSDGNPGLMIYIKLKDTKQKINDDAPLGKSRPALIEVNGAMTDEMSERIVKEKGIKVISKEKMNTILQINMDNLKTVVTGISEGDARISPLKVGEKKPCDYCDYADICRFDPRQGDRYRLPAKKS